MCLDNIKGPFIAPKDIVCYKHFNIQTIKSEERYVSSYKNHIWPKKGMRSALKIDYKGKKVSKGLHAFRTKISAQEDAKDVSAEVVVRMLIPKGSKYYTGVFDRWNAIASNRMLFHLPKKKK